MKQITKTLSILFFILLSSCNNGDSRNINKSEQTISVNAKELIEKVKYQPGDPFIETFKKSEFFKVSGLENHILETKSGTIISIPQGAFRDENGNIVEKEVQIEINDIKTIEDQILSNMTSQQGGKALQSGGSIYINATHNGKQLSLNEDSPIYIETSIKDPESDFLIFEGIRNDKGEMQWISPTPPKKYLIPIDLEELDFLPENFHLAVENGMPFKNHKTADKELVDSLYYSMKPFESSGEAIKKVNYSNENKPAFNNQSEELHLDTVWYEDEPFEDAVSTCKGIDPASIKVIKTNKYSKTFIATRDFEKRLKEIRKSKRPELLEVYINNLNLDMSTCDSMVILKLPKGSNSALKFQEFARENLRNVNNLPKSVSKLGKHYSKELKKTKERLDKLRDNYKNSEVKTNEKAREIQKEYTQLLIKRQDYRLRKFGYVVSKLGWSNIAKVLEPLEKFKLEIVIQGGASYDYVNVYTVDKNIQSIFALTSYDKIIFNRGYDHDQFLLYKKLQTATAIVIAYKDDIAYYAEQDFKVTPEVNIVLSPIETNKKDLKVKLRKLDQGHTSFNKIQVDLQFQAVFYKERERKKKLMKEREFINSLVRIAFECEKSQVEFGI